MLPPNMTAETAALVRAGTFPTPREIVSHAAAGVDAAQAREWLQRDERGTWERHAADLLERVREHGVALEIGASREWIRDECVIVLRSLALEALLRAG